MEPPLWNALNREFVGIGEQYGHSLASYTSPSPLGPFSLKKTMTPVFGAPGDSSTYLDDDGKAMAMMETMATMTIVSSVLSHYYGSLRRTVPPESANAPTVH